MVGVVRSPWAPGVVGAWPSEGHSRSAKLEWPDCSEAFVQMKKIIVAVRVLGVFGDSTQLRKVAMYFPSLYVSGF